jgi:hypothetical protein
MERSPSHELFSAYTLPELRLLARLADIPLNHRATKRQVVDALVASGYRPRGNTDRTFLEEVKSCLFGYLDRLSIQPPHTVGRLSVNPVRGAGTGAHAEPLFAELNAGTIVISELASGARVPELSLSKSTVGSTILLEGEPLVGGHQDRILNVTIMLEGVGDVVLPVTCVEAGRWGFAGRRFSSSDYHSSYTSRSRLSSSTSASLRTGGRYRSDQSGVWRDIAFSLDETGTRSATSRMSDLFDQQRDTLRQYQKVFNATAGQIGYCAAIDGVPVAFETFGTEEIFAAYWPKLLNGLALEGLTTPDVLKRAKRASPFRGELIRDVLSAAVLESFPSVGVGQDIRITGDRCHGSALVRDNDVQHFVMHWRTPS